MGTTNAIRSEVPATGCGFCDTCEGPTVDGVCDVNASHVTKFGIRSHADGAFVAGIDRDGGEFLALTAIESKNFRTLAGAARWLAKRGYSPTGERIGSTVAS